MSEAEKEAIRIMKRQLHHVSGVPELYIHVFHKGDANVEIARKCALFVVDEILKVIGTNTIEPLVYDIEHWQQVKDEIEKI